MVPLKRVWREMCVPKLLVEFRLVSVFFDIDFVVVKFDPFVLFFLKIPADCVVVPEFS